MKKQFAKLSKAERQEIESKYHRMKPEELNKLMSRATLHKPSAINRPSARAASKRKTKGAEKKRAA
jgi:hypothetical protein